MSIEFPALKPSSMAFTPATYNVTTPKFRDIVAFPRLLASTPNTPTLSLDFRAISADKILSIFNAWESSYSGLYELVLPPEIVSSIKSVEFAGRIVSAQSTGWRFSNEPTLSNVTAGVGDVSVQLKGELYDPRILPKRPLLGEIEPYITNGLICYLDTRSSNSYPGTGTVWTDLSGAGNHGTLVNTPTFANKIMSFAGSNNYVSVGTNLRNTSYTVMALARYTGTNNGRVISSNDGNWLMGWHANNVDRYYAEGWVTLGKTAETGWICYAATGNYSSDSWQLYRNGVSIAGPNSEGSNGPIGIRIGGWVSGEYSACQAKALMIYNRVLTAAEISVNYSYLTALDFIA